MQPLHHHLFGAVLCVFLPTMLRDDEFDDAALALGSAAGADCDSDGVLFPTVAILVLVSPPSSARQHPSRNSVPDGM